LLGAAAAAVAAVALTLGLLIAPPDELQGQPQRLMYVHVPAAWTAFACYAVVCLASAAYLASRRPVWDAAARAAAELGVGMNALAIVVGSIWGRSVWGVWWSWDARLVSATLLLLIYLGYLAMRGIGADPKVTATRAAVVGMLGFAQVPVVYFSVYWWRTLHQQPTILVSGASPPIEARMAGALGAGVVAFTLAGAWFFARRLGQLRRSLPERTLLEQSRAASAELVEPPAWPPPSRAHPPELLTATPARGRGEPLAEPVRER
jgi:heme exporter protein C